ncbi:MAG: DUF6056 family protein [Lachnospiraceae bacterium]|nr:DUF6056 family protein [Lachnospiraceae bacterium]
MERLKKYTPYLVILCMLLGLCWLFPYTGDDWAWGSSIGIERLNTWFYNYNGRYLGNIMALIMTRSNLVKTVLMAVLLGICIWGIVKVGRNRLALPLTCFLLVFVPRLIFRQAVVWTAGFSNYVVSAALVMLYVVEAYPYLHETVNEDKWKISPVKIVAFPVLGFLSSLLMENMTIYGVVVSLVMVGYCLIRWKKLPLHLLTYSAGTIGGAIYMFSNLAYHSIQTGEDTYRTMASGTGGLLSRAWENYSTVIAPQLVQDSFVLNLALIAVLMLAFGSLRKEMNGACRMLCAGSIGLMLLYVSASLLTGQYLTSAHGEIMQRWEVLGTIVFLAALLVGSTVISVYGKRFWETLFVNCSWLCMLLPLLFVTPIGGRCLFSIYLFEILLAVELIGQCDLKEDSEGQRNLRRGLALAALGGMAFYYVIFLANYKTDRSRLAYIRRQVEKGQTEIRIRQYPYEDYLWCATPQTGSVWETRYKLYYHLPEEISLLPVAYSEE